MLYEKLFSIYKDNNFLRDNFDFQYYYPRLSQYLSEEVNQKNEYLSPYRFSKMFDILLEEAIKFFLAISSANEEGLIRVVYKHRCENCDAINFYSTNDVLDNQLLCESCSDEIYGIEKDMDVFVLVFEISTDLIHEFQSLKVKPLSKVDADIGRGVSLNTASILLEDAPKLNDKLNSQVARIKGYSKIAYR